MIGDILSDTIQRLESYQREYPEENCDIQLQLEALKAHIKWVRSYWEEPTLEDLQINP